MTVYATECPGKTLVTLEIAGSIPKWKSVAIIFNLY